MKIYQKYLVGALFAFFIVFFYGICPVSALEVKEYSPAEIIDYNEPVDINSSLSATLPSYFFQGMHIGSTDGSGGVLFANGTIINISRTRKDNKPIPVTLGDDLRVDGEIWRGTAKGVSDNMPLKISDNLVPTLRNTYDLGDNMRQWRNIFLTGLLQGNDAKFNGDVDFTDANVIGLSQTSGVDLLNSENNWLQENHFDEQVTFGGGYGNSGITIDKDGNLSMDGTIIVGAGFDFNTLNVGGGQGDSGLTMDDSGNILTDGRIELGGGYASGGITISDSGNINSNGTSTFWDTTEFFGKLIIPVELSEPATCDQGEIILKDTGSKEFCVCKSTGSGNWSCISLP